VDFRALLTALTSGVVRFILAGGVAAVVQGVPVHTYEVAAVHARDPENQRRLIAVLRQLDAHYRQHRTKKLEPREEDLGLPGTHLLATRLGPLDLLGCVLDKWTYEDLLGRSIPYEFADGLRVQVLDLELLVEIKEALGREKDRAQVLEYRRTLEERRKGERRPPPEST
jgi:hypothetical protein